MSHSSWTIARKLSPCRIVDSMMEERYCSTHGQYVPNDPMVELCDGFYSNIKILNEFYSNAFRAGMGSSHVTYPRTPEED